MVDHTQHDVRQQDADAGGTLSSAFAFDQSIATEAEAQPVYEVPSSDTAAPWPLPGPAEVIAHPALATLARRGMLQTYRLSAIQAVIKRAIDISGSLAALVVLSPILIAITGLLAIRPGPILFTQERIGERGRIFRCYKFRTMRVGAESMLTDVLERDEDALEEWSETRKLSNDPRVTRLGGLLRKTSLDELPQLINVLRGDMSLVGPRPIVWREVSRYRGFIRYYLSVKPGLTGLWQVSGRNHTTYPRRVALDRAYVRKYSVALDLAIMLRTIPALLRGEGAY